MNVCYRGGPFFIRIIRFSRSTVLALSLFSGLHALAYWPPLHDVWSVFENTNSTEWRISFGVDDPVSQKMENIDTGWFQAAAAGITTNNGVLVWNQQLVAGGLQTLNFNVYDPGRCAWQTTNITSILPQTSKSVADGVVAWVERNGSLPSSYLGAATYDPALQRWMILRTYTITGDVIYATQNGTIAFLENYGSTHYLNCWIYDPLLHDWRTRRFGPYSSTFAVFSFDNGSIIFRTSQQSYLMGYSYLSGSWSLDNPTYPLTAFHTSTHSGSAPLTVWFTDLSIAAKSWNWSFGDGSYTTQRSPYHIFSTPGTYNVTLTAGSFSTNVTIYVAPTPRLNFIGILNNKCQLQLVSGSNSVFMLESSTNLQNWSSVRSITNDAEVVDVEEAVLPQVNARFFRARQVIP